MFKTSHFAFPRRLLLVATLGIVSCPAWIEYVYAGVQHNFGVGNNNLRVNNVGGVEVDAEGVVANVAREVRAELKQKREAMATDVPKGMDAETKLRKVSLRDLQKAVTDVRLGQGRRMLPESIRFMGGIQRIQYVFVYPDDNDIILAGPAEGWRRDELNAVVGETTGKPVVVLEHFLAALRAAMDEDRQVISCSIDPTPEGVQRMRQYVAEISGDATAAREPDKIARQLEQQLGMQTITLTGIDPTSRFAGVMVASDYWLKRMAMGFEAAPVKGLPSYLDMVGSRRNQNMMPRWWLEDDYEALLTDGEGLAWELKGQGVKVMSEEELVAADGTRKGTGKVDPIARKWADNMTAKYDELAAKEAIFGQLRNCMDVAVVSALIASERLDEKAGLDLSNLLNADFVPLNKINAPRQIPTQVSYRRKDRHLVLTASGGVQMNSWQVARQREKTVALAGPRDDAIAPPGAAWWWD